MTLLLMIPTLRRTGGAERAMSLLAAAAADKAHDVSLLTYADPGVDFFSLDGRTRLAKAAAEAIRTHRLKRVMAGWERPLLHS